MTRSAGPRDVAVRIDHLTKRYGDTVAVDDVSFSVRRGELFGLLGPNGAGKTTALECLEGLRAPDAGSLEVCGIDVGQNPSRARTLLGVQLQSSGLPATMRVGEAMDFFCAYRGVDPRHDLLERFALGSKLRSPFGSLSGGQQRRLVLALALAHEPQVLVLDEPTSGLDVPTRAELHSVLRELKAAGGTILLATHDMAEAESLCDRVAIMLRGRTVAVASPDELTATGAGLTTVSVRTTKGTFLDSDHQIAGTDLRRVDGDYARWLSTDPAATVTALLTHLKTSSDELVDLRVTRPSLEERFLELIRSDETREERP
ncbi:MAG TPA: ABC transporter ATP-binding protein [Acidimicrobiia bacterium]|nr:ABC transporter ATP-binding protein [Acidimicrobiia bacterium]